jgi:hypothetical protein
VPSARGVSTRGLGVIPSTPECQIIPIGAAQFTTPPLTTGHQRWRRSVSGPRWRERVNRRCAGSRRAPRKSTKDRGFRRSSFDDAPTPSQWAMRDVAVFGMVLRTLAPLGEPSRRATPLRRALRLLAVCYASASLTARHRARFRDCQPHRNDMAIAVSVPRSRPSKTTSSMNGSWKQRRYL